MAQIACFFQAILSIVVSVEIPAMTVKFAMLVSASVALGRRFVAVCASTRALMQRIAVLVGKAVVLGKFVRLGVV